MTALQVTVTVLLALSGCSCLPSPGEGKELIWATVLQEPYAKLTRDADNLTGNDRYEGFAVDILAELAKMNGGFKYMIKESEDGKWGGLVTATGTYNGLIAEVMDGRADVAFGPITVTSNREKVVDFTHPFMNAGSAILHRKELISVAPNSTIVVTYEKTNYSTDVHVTTYKKFDCIEQLVSQDEVKLGTKKSGSAHMMIQKSKDPRHVKLMEKLQKDQSLTMTTEEGIVKVKAGGYAYITYAPTIEYQMARDPLMYKVGGDLDDLNYGFLVKKGSPLRDILSLGLLELEEAGTLRALKDKWWLP